MSYVYEAERPYVFTEEGQVKFLRIRDHVRDTLAKSGAITAGVAINGVAGLTWEAMACVDRLVELGELHEVGHGPCAWQSRVFVRGRLP